MLSELQRLVNGTPSGGLLNLGKDKTFKVGEDPLEEYPFFLGDAGNKQITITGQNCHILVGPTKLDHRPTMMVRGGTRLLDDVTVHGYSPPGQTYDDHRAFKHCIELQGPQGFECTWNREETWGAGIQIGKRVIQGKPNRWTKGLWIHGSNGSEGMKKQHVAINNLIDGKIEINNWKDCGHTAIDVEPPGSDAGCQHLVVGPGDLYAPYDFVFGNKGKGGPGSCNDITFRGIRCHGQWFNVRSVPTNDPPVHRTNYLFEDCESDIIANISTMTFWYVDGLIIRRIKQRMTPNVKMARFNHCTDFECDVPYVST